jgi:prefoldin subunit 5
MAKEMGGVISRKEMDELEVIYQQKIQTIQAQLPIIESKIASLKTLKDQFSELSTPTPSPAPTSTPTNK